MGPSGGPGKRDIELRVPSHKIYLPRLGIVYFSRRTLSYRDRNRTYEFFYGRLTKINTDCAYLWLDCYCCGVLQCID